jgi:two-component system response regulator HydG
MPPRIILICDDEEEILRYLRKLLTSQGYAVETFTSGTSLLERLADCTANPADLLLQDVRMPDLDGTQVLARVRQLCPALPVVMMTAYGTIDTAVDAIKAGAYDYVTKPFPREKILGVIGHILEHDRLKEENRFLREKLDQLPHDRIIFASSRFRAVYDLALQVAASDANIMILGESGTGKELIASTIHENSLRNRERFFSINCAALSDTLLESQLFGHVRGAFTGAVAAQKGILEETDGGTLFLDEIGDMSPAIQAKLLRVIQERDFLPVGSTRPRSVDIRFVAATNKDLELEVRAGRFREDLYYRLNVISIELPPLRERREDIEPLALHFISRFARRLKKNISGIADDACELLRNYHWPGNVRELENVMERATILARGREITVDTLPFRNQPLKEEPPRQKAAPVSLEDLERDHIRAVLSQTGFHKSRTAEILGISRKTLDRKIAEYSLSESQHPTTH